MTTPNDRESIGTIQSVDTGNVSITVADNDVLNSVQVNQVVKITSTKMGEEIIGLIAAISRIAIAPKVVDDLPENQVENLIKVNLVGTLSVKTGRTSARFTRSIGTVPSVGASCFLLKGDELSKFMDTISTAAENPLTVGKYTISEDSVAKLDGNKFFQRHAVIVGGTGSGKSYTVANILEKANALQSVNCIILDLHGEYAPLRELKHAEVLKVAGPADSAGNDNIIFLPYWLLSYEEIEAFLLDRSDSNAPNQARALFEEIIQHKREFLEREDKKEVLNNFTVDSPVPYKISDVLDDIKKSDEEMVQGSRGEKQGPLFGKLTRFIQRLESKRSDRRLHFLFNDDEKLLKYDWLSSLIDKLFDFGAGDNGIKIVDVSEVPSDILPLVSGLLARLVFSIQQWTVKEKRHPIALFCDEAHLYIPANPQDKVEERGLKSFDRIAKEGRKYGFALVVISQRPADVSKTVLSQCGNFVAMRLTNPDDQNVIKRLFPDNLGDFAELLPILDVGESLIVGDACLLPSRVRIDEPTYKPDSATVDFWDEWNAKKSRKGYREAIEALRKQKK